MLLSLTFEVVKNGYLTTIVRREALEPVAAQGPQGVVELPEGGMAPDQVAALARSMGMGGMGGLGPFVQFGRGGPAATTVERVAFHSKEDLLTRVRHELEPELDGSTDDDAHGPRGVGVAVNLHSQVYALQRLERGFLLTITRPPAPFAIDQDEVEAAALKGDAGANHLALAAKVFVALQNRAPSVDRYVFEGLEALMASLRDDVPAASV